MNKTLRKIRHDAKALSPVVASIILIAVTVAVSIAVAAWMGGMTVGFMGSSSLTITNVQFDEDTPNTITLALKNTGTKTVTIAALRINNQLADVDTVDPSGDNSTVTLLSLNAGDKLQVTITDPLAAWINGNTYKIDLYDGSNQVIGSTQQNAPGA